MCCSFVFVLLFVVVCLGFLLFLCMCGFFGVFCGFCLFSFGLLAFGVFLMWVFLSAMIKAIIMKHFSLRLITYVIYENYYLTVST